MIPTTLNNPEWIAASVRYMENYCDTVLAALDKPYSEAMAAMDQASLKALNDFSMETMPLSCQIFLCRVGVSCITGQSLRILNAMPC